MQRMVHVAIILALSLSHAAAIKLDVQCPQFLDKNFQQFLIICSPGVKHVWEVKSLPTLTLTCRKLYILYEEM